MSTTPSAGSASEDYSPRSSPSRPNTASVPSYLPNQAAHTSPVRNKTTGSDAPFSSYRQSPWRTMTSPIKFEVSGFSGTGSKRQHSTFALQPSTLKQQSNEDEMHDDGAQVLEGPPGSWQRPLVIQETRNDDFGNPNDGLPLKDWEGLEARYEQDMEAAIQHEQSILDEIEWVMKMMKETTIASSKVESDRARKRLRTRIAYVQQSEQALAQKKVHYNGVVDAFQAALALLGGV